VHGLGGLFGLAGQLIQLSQGIIGGVRLHIGRKNACEEDEPRYRTHCGSLK
jgi:hypothetical protein